MYTGHWVVNVRTRNWGFIAFELKYVFEQILRNIVERNTFVLDRCTGRFPFNNLYDTIYVYGLTMNRYFSCLVPICIVELTQRSLNTTGFLRLEVSNVRHIKVSILQTLYFCNIFTSQLLTNGSKLPSLHSILRPPPSTYTNFDLSMFSCPPRTNHREDMHYLCVLTCKLFKCTLICVCVHVCMIHMCLLMFILTFLDFFNPPT